MTNVKLKLMFFLLNSLLTADVVQARPYSDNATDIVIKFTNSNNTFNIPVEQDSDTLVVANDDNPEEVSDNVDDLASMMDAEQDRDEVMSEMQDHSVLAEDAATVEKRKNISNPSLHEMIDSETDREESITDLMFRPDSELVDAMPRFEFLIAAKINESDVNRTAGVKGDSFDKNGHDVLRKADYVELVEVQMPKLSENKSAYMMNITGHEVDNDVAPDTSESPFQFEIT
ncbi:unnamed protein product [Diatraea saccharalis]|uniref:Uncharacterized protein n=1 Tax=Diatraea saccharalis TaxID=40085 RepID=A0A9N9WC63_9NEOP|nr:unnamed protein product [Diatraea saccharalis]